MYLAPVAAAHACLFVSIRNLNRHGLDDAAAEPGTLASLR